MSIGSISIDLKEPLPVISNSPVRQHPMYTSEVGQLQALLSHSGHQLQSKVAGKQLKVSSTEKFSFAHIVEPIEAQFCDFNEVSSVIKELPSPTTNALLLSGLQTVYAKHGRFLHWLCDYTEGGGNVFSLSLEEILFTQKPLIENVLKNTPPKAASPAVLELFLTQPMPLLYMLTLLSDIFQKSNRLIVHCSSFPAAVHWHTLLQLLSQQVDPSAAFYAFLLQQPGAPFTFAPASNLGQIVLSSDCFSSSITTWDSVRLNFHNQPQLAHLSVLLIRPLWLGSLVHLLLDSANVDSTAMMLLQANNRLLSLHGLGNVVFTPECFYQPLLTIFSTEKAVALLCGDRPSVLLEQAAQSSRPALVLLPYRTLKEGIDLTHQILPEPSHRQRLCVWGEKLPAVMATVAGGRFDQICVNQLPGVGGGGGGNVALSTLFTQHRNIQLPGGAAVSSLGNAMTMSMSSSPRSLACPPPDVLAATVSSVEKAQKATLPWQQLSWLERVEKIEKWLLPRVEGKQQQQQYRLSRRNAITMGFGGGSCGQSVCGPTPGAVVLMYWHLSQQHQSSVSLPPESWWAALGNVLLHGNAVILYVNDDEVVKQLKAAVVSVLGDALVQVQTAASNLPAQLLSSFVAIRQKYQFVAFIASASGAGEEKWQESFSSLLQQMPCPVHCFDHCDVSQHSPSREPPALVERCEEWFCQSKTVAFSSGDAIS